MTIIQGQSEHTNEFIRRALELSTNCTVVAYPIKGQLFILNASNDTPHRPGTTLRMVCVKAWGNFIKGDILSKLEYDVWSSKRGATIHEDIMLSLDQHFIKELEIT